MAQVRALYDSNKLEARDQGVYDSDFDDLCAIGLFTSSTKFCSAFQTELRNPTYGCKWKLTELHIDGAVSYLNFVQKMGSGVAIAAHSHVNINCIDR